jgi:hypothetical protein
MSKILIIDDDGLSFAWRCAQAGHTVKWFLSGSEQAGEGFRGVERVSNWVPHVLWADLVYAAPIFLERLEFFKKKGANIVAPSVKSAELVTDRQRGLEVCEKAGLCALPHIAFKTMKEARKHVEKTGKRFTLMTEKLEYCARSPADMLEWMSRKELSGGVVLQEVLAGTAMTISRWLGRDGWVGPWNEAFEHGTIAAPTKDSKLGVETLAKLESMLLALGHAGGATLQITIDDKGIPWVREWSAWPSFSMLIGSVEHDPAEWIIDALAGKDTTAFKPEVGCCLELTCTEQNTPVYGVTKGNRRHLHPSAIKIDTRYDMDGDKLVQRPVWTTSGEHALTITGYGDSVVQSTERANKTAKQLYASDYSVSSVVGGTLEKDLPRLQKLGYATHITYEVAA